jgi:hypothetical protein
MKDFSLSPQDWLNREDNVCREERLARLKWLADKMPSVEYLFLSGGLLSKYLFEEARYCFVYGQFLATIVLGLAFIEQSLASLFHMAGKDAIARTNICTLLREALNRGWITPSEYDNMERARQNRNPITHFRKPLGNDDIGRRSVMQDELPYTIIEQDARNVMETVFHLIGKSLLSTSNDD